MGFRVLMNLRYSVSPYRVWKVRRSLLNLRVILSWAILLNLGDFSAWSVLGKFGGSLLDS